MSIDFYGFILDFYGLLCISMDFYGFLWISIDLYRFPRFKIHHFNISTFRLIYKIHDFNISRFQPWIIFSRFQISILQGFNIENHFHYSIFQYLLIDMFRIQDSNCQGVNISNLKIIPKHHSFKNSKFPYICLQDSRFQDFKWWIIILLYNSTHTHTHAHTNASNNRGLANLEILNLETKCWYSIWNTK